MPHSSDSRDPYRKDSSIATPGGAPARPPPQPGDIVGEKYRIETVIGQGGMGAVFRARHLLTERAVALKWMLPEVGGEEAVQRFLREARAMGRIDHAGVVGVLDVGLEDGATFLVMELLKGTSLRDVLEHRERLDPAEAIRLLLPALEGVEAAHQNGVVHRDLKPENIFVVRSGDGTVETTKVLDFGISKLRDDRLDQSPQVDLKKGGLVTRTGVTIGTPSYMSPEQVRGSKDIDARTDVWSLGVILYELLTGHVPFRAESFGALLVAIAVEGYPPLDGVRPELPAMLVAAVHRALEKEPSMRFANVAAFAAALEPFAPGGMRFRAPSVTQPEGRGADRGAAAPAAFEPPAKQSAKTPELAGTAVAKPRHTPPTRQADPHGARPLDTPSISSRGLDVDPPPPAPLGHARTALPQPAREASPAADVARARVPSLPPLDLDAVPARRPVRAPTHERARPEESAPPPQSETTRYLMIGGLLLVALVVIAIGLRFLSDRLGAPAPLTSPATAPTVAVEDPSPLPPWPPPPTAVTPPTAAGSTTTSGTALSPPMAPTTTTPTTAPETPSRTRDRSRVVPPVTPPSTASDTPIPPPPTVTPATSTSAEPTGRTGSLSRDEF